MKNLPALTTSAPGCPRSPLGGSNGTHCGTVLLHDCIRRTFSQQMAVPHETDLQNGEQFY